MPPERSDFLASDYCYDVEVKRAMERHDAGEARVIPVILRPVDWKGAPFGKLQALPRDARPVTEWPNRDQAFLDIAQGIRAAAEELAFSQIKRLFERYYRRGPVNIAVRRRHDQHPERPGNDELTRGVNRGRKRWLTTAMGLALLAVTMLLYRRRRSDLPVRGRVAAAMNLFFGVTIGIMAFGHLLAVTTKLALGTLEGSTPAFYAIGIALAVPSWRSTFSRTQMLPETSMMGRTRRSAASAISRRPRSGNTMRPGLSNSVPRKASPAGFPVRGSKRMPHTMIKSQMYIT